MTPSSLREMPTVTVLAWCLIASTGRVSSSIARVSAATRSSIERGRRADLAGRALVLPRPGASDSTSREQPGEPHRGARLEVAVVAAAAQPVEEPLGERRACSARNRRERPRRRRRRSPTSALDRPRAPRAAAAPRRRSPAPPRSRTGGRPSPTARSRAPGRPAAREIVGGRRESRRRRRRRSTIGVALWARKIATSLATSSAVRPGEPGGAHEDQRLRRQVDVLLVLGDVAGDRLVAELAELDPHLLGGDLVGPVADDRPVPLRRREPPGRVGDRRSRAASTVAHRVGQLAQRRRAARGGAASIADAGRLGDRARQQRAGGDLGVERLRRGHAHLDVAAVGRVQHAVGLVGEVAAAAVDDRRAPPRRGRAADRRCGWCRWSCRSG